jgi:hypothetical protein
MRSPVRLDALGGLVALLLAPLACGPATGPGPVTKPVAPAGPARPAAPPVVTPSQWTLHPSGSLRMNARLELSPGNVLYVGDGGERWLDKGGATIAASTLLTEAIQGVTRSSDGFLFAGASGAVYVAKDALGPFGLAKKPTRKLHSVTAGKSAILGIDEQSVLQRTVDGGASWSKVDVPATDGTLLQVAMLPSGEGLALMAPQRLFISTDDGASWKSMTTPGIGARRVVADVNGDLMLEGLLASAVFRPTPTPHLDKVARPASSELQLAMPSSEGALGYGDAVRSGKGAFVGTQYVELVVDPDNATGWRFASLELGQKPKIRKLHELDGCENVTLAAREKTIVLGCDQQQATPVKKKYGYGGGYSGSYNQYQVKLLRSVDGGATFKDDGVVNASSQEKRLWLTPDGSMIVEGGCKKSKNEYACEESPPVIRMVGASKVAKVTSVANLHFTNLAFSPSGQHAYAIGHDSGGRVVMLLSQNGGKDFVRKALPPILEEGKKSQVLTPFGEGGAIDAENDGVVTVIVASANKFLRYTTTDFGATFKGSVVPLEADSLDLAGRRGFAYELSTGKAWETADAGATWMQVAAPQHDSSKGYPERSVVCGEYGCFLGDRATRVGWDIAKTGVGSAMPPPKPAPKLVGRTPIKCSVSGEWTVLGNASLPTAGNVDLGGGTRWVLPRRDPKTGAAVALVGSVNAKGGFETKEVSLFGKADADTATQIIGQIEGAAAIRYSFKRDKDKKVAAIVPPPPMYTKTKKPYPYTPPPPVGPQILPKQTVDVEVAWYLAATGKVQRATIKGVGPLDPAKDLTDLRALPSLARSGLISIAAGGVHVRPLASAASDAPLYFVREGGKVDKLPWPEVPTKDVAGRVLNIRIDAARMGKRSVLFGTAPGGIQVFAAWANEAGTAWETRSWGLWPVTDELKGEAYFRFFESGDKLFAGVSFTGFEGMRALGWAAPFTPDADPTSAIALPTQSALPDPPRPCGKDAQGGFRILLPWEKGTRHPILVSGEATDLILATNNAVTRVTPGSPACTAAFDSYRELPRTADNHVAIVAPDDLEHASLFRAKGWTADGPEVSFRPMSCAFAKGPIPEALEESVGFTE